MEDVVIKDLKTLEFEIVQLKGQTAQNIIEIGKRLIEAKNQVQHGQWLEWLRTKVSFSQQTANNFMRVAEEFPNYNSISNLSQTKIFALLNASQEVRNEILERNDIGEISVNRLKEEIKKVTEENSKLKESNQVLLEDLDSAQRLAAEQPQVIEKEIIKEVEVIKQVVPNDYEQLKKDVLERERRNRELEAEINQREKKITELQLTNDQVVNSLPSTKQLERLINDAWEFSRTCESFLKDVGGLIYLTQSIAELPAQERAYYERSIENVWAWANVAKFNLEKEVSNE